MVRDEVLRQGLQDDIICRHLSDSALRSGRATKKFLIDAQRDSIPWAAWPNQFDLPEHICPGWLDKLDEVTQGVDFRDHTPLKWWETTKLQCAGSLQRPQKNLEIAQKNGWKYRAVWILKKKHEHGHQAFKLLRAGLARPGLAEGWHHQKEHRTSQRKRASPGDPLDPGTAGEGKRCEHSFQADKAPWAWTRPRGSHWFSKNAASHAEPADQRSQIHKEKWKHHLGWWAADGQRHALHYGLRLRRWGGHISRGQTQIVQTFW